MFEHEILLGLAAFAVKHFFCDFILQSQHMIREKAHYGRLGGLQHAGIHSAGTVMVLLALDFDPVISVGLALVDGVVHYHVDWTKSKAVSHFKFTPADSGFWVWLGLDQLAHYLTYIAIFAIAIQMTAGA